MLCTKSTSAVSFGFDCAPSKLSGYINPTPDFFGSLLSDTNCFLTQVSNQTRILFDLKDFHPAQHCYEIDCADQIDPAEQDSRNDLSHYTVDGQTLWSSAYTYCTADSSTPIECDEGSRYLDAANETLPELLRSAEGSLEWAQYREQVRGRTPFVGRSLFLNEGEQEYMSICFEPVANWCIHEGGRHSWAEVYSSKRGSRNICPCVLNPWRIGVVLYTSLKSEGCSASIQLAAELITRPICPSAGERVIGVEKHYSEVFRSP